MGTITRSGHSVTQLQPAQQVTIIDILDALSEYRAAETAMLRRTRSMMERGATDALALRYIKEASATGKGMRPTELSTRLGMSSASVTALVDRLVHSGAVTREPHPADRRSLILKSTSRHDGADLTALDDARQPLAQVIEAVHPEDLSTIKDFINNMREAMHEVAKTD